jgi:hypothetical protein
LAGVGHATAPELADPDPHTSSGSKSGRRSVVACRRGRKA